MQVVGSVPSKNPGRERIVTVAGRWSGRSKAVDIDHGQLVYPSLNRFAIVMHLHELAPGGGWAASRRDGWRFQRLAEVCQNLTSRGLSHPGLRPLANLRFEVSRLLARFKAAGDTCASAAAGRDRPAGPRTQTARVPRRHWLPAAWTSGRGRAARGLFRPVEVGTDVEHRLVVIIKANQSVTGHLQVVGHPDRDRRDGGEHSHVQPVEPLRA